MKNHSLIVGGTAGSGRALVRHFARKGHLVSVLGRRELPSAERRLKGVFSRPLDVRDTSDLRAALQEIEKRAAITNIIFFQRFRGDGDAWSEELAVSLTATKTIIETCTDPARAKSLRSIVILSSVAAEFIAEEQPAGYHVAKAGLVQLMRYYAATLGKRGIRVNAVSPCTTLKAENRNFYLKNKPLMNLYHEMIPLGRLGTSADVVNAIDFLCGPQASFITGLNMTIDGGLSLLWPEGLVRRLTASKAVKKK